ncbi:Protein CBG26493 [Caenorhabditis briggsae]|uniref:Protein CBG26493 n=1 Tax=Caenorhabditis briggsae TaxID=6238 RepID=B6IH44_CAEBR|nr:Protein CBG26493 [Caenorhabditis briggsae]CAR99224.1 Protein CBG26493 [Caenorhabditis briggsae]
MRNVTSIFEKLESKAKL